jgi:hypothetical protein
MKMEKITYIGGTEEQEFDDLFENTWPTPPEVEEAGEEKPTAAV